MRAIVAVPIVGVLLDAGADVNGRDEDGRHALQTALLTGNKEVALLLLEWGADVNAPGREHGETSGWNAIIKGWDDVAYSSWKMRLGQLQDQVQRKLNGLEPAVLVTGADADSDTDSDAEFE